MSESTWDDPRITAFVLGEMSGDEQAAFEAQVQSDAALAAAVEEARGVTEQLQSLYANESTPPLDPERRSAIVNADSRSTAATQQVMSPPVSPPPMSWRVPGLVLAAAAVLLLLVGIAPWLRQQDRTVAMDDPIAVDTKVDTKTEPAAPAATTTDDESLLEEKSLVKDKQLAVDAAADAFDAAELEAALADKVSDEQGAPEPFGPSLAQRKMADNTQSKSAQRGMQAPAQDSPFAEAEEVSGKKLDRQSGRNEGSLGGGGLGGSLSGTSNVGDASGNRGRRGSPVPKPRMQGLGDRNVDSKKATPEPPSAESEDRAAFRQSPLESAARGNKGAAAQPMPDPAPASIPAPAQPAPTAPAVMKRADSAKQESADAPADAAPEPRSGIERAKTVEKELQQKQQQIERSVKEIELLEEIAEAPAPVPMPGEARMKQAEMKKLRDLSKQNDGVNRNPNSLFGGPRLSKDPVAGGFDDAEDLGRGAGISGDKFEPITDNAFIRVAEEPLSTFSVDVDTASYSKTRDFLLRANRLPRPDAVRIEELVNYFEYDYEAPAADAEHPFATHVAVTSCPWNQDHRLARIALKGKTMTKAERPPCNLVFLLDTSGSMNAPNKLPLVVEGMKMLLDQLGKKDRVAITVYAGSAGLVLDSTPAKQKQKIRAALTALGAGGSTNGGAGIALAYRTARENFIEDGVNRVILCTDGDFNVGLTGTDELVRMVEREAKDGTFLSVLGFGMGNHNDAMLERISGRGNGNYAFIDTKNEARKVLVDQTSGTLVTIAKDVKMQVDFNPMHISQYRLIGYENRVLEAQDFNDDKKDAGEIGAGHSVTALYELVPAGLESDASQPAIDESEFVKPRQLTDAAKSNVTFKLRLRYKLPDEDESTLVIIPVQDDEEEFENSHNDVRFAAAVAGFGMQLRRSRYKGSWTLSDVLNVAQESKGADEYELRAEFVDLVRRASSIMGEE